MEKFKPGDIVIFDREAIEADWLGIGKVDVELLLGEKYTIEEYYDPNKAVILKEYINGPAYPSSMFSLANPLKLELNKLKETILNPNNRVRCNDKERKLFNKILRKLDINTNKHNFNIAEGMGILFGGFRIENNLNDYVYYKSTNYNEIIINFKDLIEPFKKFRDEIL